jgi:hypothetical protein
MRATTLARQILLDRFPKQVLIRPDREYLVRQFKLLDGCPIQVSDFDCGHFIKLSAVSYQLSARWSNLLTSAPLIPDRFSSPQFRLSAFKYLLPANLPCLLIADG